MNTGPLSKHLEPEIDDDRIARNWNGVDRKIAIVAVRSRYRRIAGVVAALAVVSWFGFWKFRPRAPLPELAVISVESDVEPRTLFLTDGSQIQMEQHSRIDPCATSAGDVCVSLHHGDAQFTVAHRDQGTFVVRVGDAEVRVVGTRFRVTRQVQERNGNVTVVVDEGVVEVRVAGGSPRRLRAGESWSETLQSAPNEVDGPVTGLAWSGSAQADALQVSPGDTAARQPQLPANPAASESPRPTGSSKEPEVEVDALRDRARQARLRGDTLGEASAYEELLSRFPKHRSAGLAAFELARLRMEKLGDVAGAIALLERLANGGGPLREDTLARLARAYARTGRSSDCSRVKASYLASYPQGAHARALEALCP